MTTGRIERPAYAWAGIGLQIFVGIMAVPVGTLVVLDPGGSPAGILQVRSWSRASSSCW